MMRLQGINKMLRIDYDYGKLDFNQPITSKHIDWEVYKNKFIFVDEYRKLPQPRKDWFEKIWNDCTMFSYMFLRLDGVPLVLYPYQDIIINDPYRFKYFEAANQIGKVLDNDTDILTYNRGWVKNGELRVGDVVFGSDGNPTTILKVFPHKDWQFYKITFNDGSYIFAGKEHLWKCKTENERFRKEYRKGLKTWKNKTYNKWVVRRTDEIIDSGQYSPMSPRNGKEVSIPISNPVDIDTMGKLVIKPYLLGLLIGDGGYSNKGCVFTTDDEELVEGFRKDYKVIKFDHQQYRINGISKDLKSLGIQGGKSWNKFIPKRYLSSGIEDRKSLLRGLMDTDGSVYGKHSTLEFCTTSEQLKDDFKFLVNSLGGKLNKITKRKPFFYKDDAKIFGKEAYYIRFSVPFNPFKLRRKAVKFIPMKAHKYERIIKKIEKAHVGDGACIMVDNEDHTYLAGRDLIVTHNSITLDVVSVFDFTHEHKTGHNSAIVSKSLPQATHQMRRIKSLLDTASFEWKSSKGDTENMSVISLDIKDENGRKKWTNYLIVAPSSEGLLGYDLHQLNLDEFEFWDDDTKYFYEQIAEPRTYHTKGDICIFTNPNGQESFGAELNRIKLPDGTKKFHTYNFNFMDKPGNTQRDLDFASAGKTRSVVESTLLAIRSISSKNYFTPQEIEKSRDNSLTELDMVSKQPIFFLDVGAKHDQSVLVGGFVEYDNMQKDVHGNPVRHFYLPIIHTYPVGYPLARVVGSNVDVNDGWGYEKSVREYLEEWSQDGTQPMFGVDVTGNSGITPLFNTAGIYPQDIVFSGPKKSGMYQRFKYMMEKGLLHRIPSQAFDYQASHLEMQKTARGYLAIHHASEDDLDDIMDAVAGFIHLSDNPDCVEASLTVI